MGIPPSQIEGFRNADGRINTIRVDSKVVHETDTGRSEERRSRSGCGSRSTPSGKIDWPRDSQGRPIYPEGFEELAEEARAAASSAGPRRALHRQRRHADRGLGLQHRHAHRRPAAVHVAAAVRAGRRARPAAHEPTSSATDGLMTEEVAKVFGVPFEVIPFKANPAAAPKPPQKRHHVHALPGRAQFEISFPRVEGYRRPFATA